MSLDSFSYLLENLTDIQTIKRQKFSIPSHGVLGFWGFGVLNVLMDLVGFGMFFF